MTYQMTTTGSILRTTDGAQIPADPHNVDYQAFQAWVAAGNTATPYVAPPVLPTQALSALNYVTGPAGQIMRCMAAGVAVPPTWSAYVLALRNISNGTDTTSTALPTPPAFVLGT